jgi:murein DD-endopeptidase MepM/ murein hydrolase activator NlpD
MGSIVKLTDFIIPFTHRPIIIGQGFHGHSHRMWEDDCEDFSYSIDFILPEHSEIIASRSGIVTKIKIDGKKNYSGKDPDLGQFAYLHDMNEIEIQHDDGTFASYSHIFYNGAVVKLGEKVVQGQLIGYSGNTGWSSQPHLDFCIFQKNVNGLRIKSLDFKFNDYDGFLENSKIKKN